MYTYEGRSLCVYVYMPAVPEGISFPFPFFLPMLSTYILFILSMIEHNSQISILISMLHASYRLDPPCAFFLFPLVNGRGNKNLKEPCEHTSPW